MRNKEKGITLVALIVTIIVLVILAAVTIKVAFDSNFIGLATKGTENYAGAQVKESTMMDNTAEYLGEAVSNITSAGQGTEGETPTTPEEPEEPEKPEEPQLPTGWDAKKVYAVTSEDNITVPVPIGFTPSKVAGEKRVDGGFVIKQDETQNEFVWVPTDSTFGKLYEFGEYNNSEGKFVAYEEPQEITYLEAGYREPDVLRNTTNGDASTETGKGIDQLKTVVGITEDNGKDIITNWEEQLKKEYSDMKTSVTTYGGFYIGRYETGDLSKDKAVVAKGNEDISDTDNSGDLNWYVQYQKNKTIAQGTGISSSMIWGCQWDAVMKWFWSYEDTKGYVTNSEGKGNYAGTQEGGNKRIATGSNPKYSVKNIYDMGGNVSDGTIEAGSYNSRVKRRRPLHQ